VTSYLFYLFYQDEGQEDEFDRTIQGPWMKKWEITHQNVHTKKHEEMEKSK